MPYTKHNYQKGDELLASQLNDMDDQIALNEQTADTLVTVSNTQPLEEKNRVWVKATPSEIEIPTMEDVDELNRQLSDIEPTFFKIQDHIFGTNGGIYRSTKVHRNASTMRRTTPIKLNSGDHVIAYLAATNAYLPIAIYSSDSISEETYLDSINGTTDAALNKYEYTATRECYIIFSTFYATDFENACAFVINNYTNGENIIYTEVQRVNNAISSDDKIIEPLIRPNTAINANGNIIIKNKGFITNKIYRNGNNKLSIHTLGCYAVTVNTFNENDVYLGRYEFTYLAIPSDLDFYVVIPIGDEVSYTIICGDTNDWKEVKINAFYGASAKTNYIEPTKEYRRAFIDSAAHRGWSLGYPENTIISTVQAKKHYFKSVENDIRFTSDGVAVLLHDENINRVARNSDGTEISETINIADITYEQALTYDFGIYAGTEFAGTKICTLEEQLIICKKLGLNVWCEMKVTGHAADIINIVKKCGMENNVIYTSFTSTALSQVLAIDPNATVMLTRLQYSAEYLAECVALKADNIVYASLDYRYVTQEQINSLMSSGIKLGLYTVDNYEALLAINPYVTKVCSTYFAADIVIAENQLNT